MCPAHNRIKLEFNNRKKFEKYINIWKLNNQIVKEESGIRKYF